MTTSATERLEMTLNVTVPRFEYWRVSIVGESPLLLSYMKFDADPKNSPLPSGARMTPQEEARGNVRYNDEGNPCVTGESIYRCLTYTAKFFKKGRGSLKGDVTVGLQVMPSLSALIPIRYGDRFATADDFEIDIRTAVPPKQGKVVRGRPRFDIWALTFDLQIDPDVVPAKLLPQLIVTAGYRSGMGDFRPSCPHGGPYGRFRLTEFIALDEQGKPIA